VDPKGFLGVQANKWVDSGPGLFPHSVLVSVGQLTNVSVDDTDCHVDYVIAGLPENTEFFVDVTVKDQSKFKDPGNTGIGFSPVGEWIFTLTREQPSNTGVDFRGTYYELH
jgi:hypothetical protein